MADSLPLIPEKGGVCTDVRPLLRTTFRELHYMPPISIEGVTPEKPEPVNENVPTLLPAIEDWTDRYRAHCDEIWDLEGEVKRQHAKRIAREPLPNVFQLHQPDGSKELPEWTVDRGLITRSDLKPTIDQDAGLDGNLWIKNILNVSSGDISSLKNFTPQVLPVKLMPPEDISYQSYSIGAVRLRAPPPPLPAPYQPAPLDSIICIPPELNFINFVIGNVYTQSIRLNNISKFECRLSITPPKRMELNVEIYSSRGLIVTSGAAAELKIHFRPSDVRKLNDTLHIRVSCGQTFEVPIYCYILPPILDIFVPSVRATLLHCTSDEEEVLAIPAELENGDVLELGARLLGDVHCAHVLLRCDAGHAQFFVLTDEAWINWKLDCITTSGSVVSGSFVFWPAWLCGGGEIRACVWCLGTSVGVSLTTLRVLSSTAVNRQLHLLADVLLFKPYHLTIEAQPKDYDICSDDDPACDHYVNLGTAFPHRSLAGTVQLFNHSPVVYNYYWRTRPWGVCSCWEEERNSESSIGVEEDSDRLCDGAKASRTLHEEDPEAYEKLGENARLLEVKPEQGQIPPRSSCTIHVQLPDVGGVLGLQRAVFMLILKDIPKDSFPEDYEPMIVNTKEVETMPVPGVPGSTRLVCEVVIAQIEVWWEVVPLRFVLEPPVLPLHHSRRLQSIPVHINAWQLFGCDVSHVEWKTPERVPELPRLSLTLEQSAVTEFTLPLPILPSSFPETDVFTMVAENNEWKSTCMITRRCDTRYPSMRPVRIWLGVVLPKQHLQTVFKVINDTYQTICFWCEAYRWWGENEPSPACQGQIPCEFCRELACTCAMLKPSRGTLYADEVANLCYDVHAPERDGCVATLVQARRCEPDCARVHNAPATETRASLVAYRVLAPRVILRVLPCFGGNQECSVGCGLDPGDPGSKLGSVTLRPSRTLIIGRPTCYRLCITNITPLPTDVVFDKPIDSTDVLKVTFTPNEFSLRGYGSVSVRVVLEARKVCTRRIFVYRAQATHAHKPVYLVVDTAITGIEITCQVPIGGGVHTDEIVVMRRSQREQCCDDECMCKPATCEEMFVAEDSKRAVVEENICRCRFEMVYIPPVKRPEPPPPEDEITPIELVTTPPPLTRVCSCTKCSKAYIPDAPESISLQFINIPLRTVCERRLILRNQSVVTARWYSGVRRWPRRHTRTLNKDQWADGVSAPGIAVSCSPSSGVLAAHATVDILVQVYADCWGLYWTQILIKFEKVEPIVLDVWVHAIGSPLQVLLGPSNEPDEMPIVWMTSTDPCRTLRVKNISRSEFTIHAYITQENERAQDMLPFRLYLRFYDVPPKICPCFPDYHFETEATSESSLDIDYMYPGIEVYLGPDYGIQCNDFYQVSPEVCSMPSDECLEWKITLNAPPCTEIAPDGILLLRLIPLNTAGEHWYREEPPPQPVRLRQAPRANQLKLSCNEVVVKICALNLPCKDFLRVRKYFYMQNVGNGDLDLTMHTSVPWCMVHSNTSRNGHDVCGTGCQCIYEIKHRSSIIQMTLPPRSCTEMCVEVCISIMEAWPQGAKVTCGPCMLSEYEPRHRETTLLHIYDDHQMLLTLPLILDIEYPIINIKPLTVDFGFVTDGDTRKTYVTVSHTSRTETLDLETHWIGCDEYKIWPPNLRIAPGCSETLYIQYTAKWRGDSIAEGCAVVNMCYGAGRVINTTVEIAHCTDRPQCVVTPESYLGWCRACVTVHARPARDYKCHKEPHDHTDDTHLLPPDMLM